MKIPPTKGVPFPWSKVNPIDPLGVCILLRSRGTLKKSCGHRAAAGRAAWLRADVEPFEVGTNVLIAGQVGIVGKILGEKGGLRRCHGNGLRRDQLELT